MKLREKLTVITLIAVAFIWVSPAFSQDEGASRGEYNKDSKRLLSRVLQNPDSAPEGLRQEIVSLRESQDGVRDAWVNEFRPAKGASIAEIREAREAFQAEYSEQIQASRELRVRVMNKLREGAREAIDESEWNEEARALYGEYKETQSELDQAWRAVKAELGDDLTRRELNSARRRFNEANADLIAKQKELAISVRQLIRENRGDVLNDREALPEELQDLRSDMDTLRFQMRQRQRQAREEMRGMPRREREQYRQELLQELRELHDDIKQRRRQVIDQIRDGQDGDRRPEG